MSEAIKLQQLALEVSKRNIMLEGYMLQVVTGLQTSCYKSVHKLSAGCVRTACSHVVATCGIISLVVLLQGCHKKSDTALI